MNEMNIPEIDPIFNEGLFRNTKKMTALFVIDRVKHIGIDEINPKSAWIFNEPTIATVKHDGTGVLVENNEIFVRRSVKPGKNIPEGFRLAEFDPFTKTMFGVEPLANSGVKKMFAEAMIGLEAPLEDGTFELVGPKINGNPEKLAKHELIRHGINELVDFPDIRDINPNDAFETLKKIFTDFQARGIEGIVWWGSNDRRVKLRVNDFFGDPNRR